MEGIAGIGGSASLGPLDVGNGGKVGLRSVGIVGGGGNLVDGSVGDAGIVGTVGDAGAAGAGGLSRRWRAARLASMLRSAAERAKRMPL